MMKSTLLVIALAAGTAYADEPKPAPAADAKPKDDAPKDAPKDAAKDTAPKDASGAAAEVKAGTGVEKHEVVGEATSFPAGTTVWVWSLVTNGEGNVKHVWKRDGKEVWSATLPVGSKRWATSSRRTIPAAGSWEVAVTTDAGAQIGTVAFTIQ
ncbi:MAG TPA: DUF2914 domain-containing protein [Kofleriaceae bacterium]